MNSLLRASWISICLVAFLIAFARETEAENRDPAIQVRFIESLELIGAGDYSSAITLLRAILAKDPSLARVRLELARAYFLAEEWELARREFFTVLSGDIPGQVRQNILAFLREIDRRRGWSWDFNIALVSGAAQFRSYDTDTVALDLGQAIPFQVNRPDPPDFGISYGGYLEFQDSFVEGDGETPSVGSRIRALANFQDFSGSEWDDHFLGLTAKGILTYPETTLELGPSIYTRLYGGETLGRRIGAEGSITNRSIEDWSARIDLATFAVDDDISDERDGVQVSGQINLLRSLSGTTVAGLLLRGDTLDAESDAESYDEVGAGLLFSTNLPHGLTVNLRPEYRIREYDAAQPLFFKSREDRVLSLDAQVIKNNWIFYEYSPYISYRFESVSSNIGIFSYDDHRVMVGFSKTY